MDSTILHIIEAAGWQADYVPEDSADPEEMIRVPLMCFALVEEPGRFSPRRRVVGLCGDAGADVVPVTEHVVPGYRLAGYSHREWGRRELRLPDAPVGTAAADRRGG